MILLCMLLYNRRRHTALTAVLLTSYLYRTEAERGVQQKFSEKELRRDAFALAEARYAELEPALQRLNELEAEQLALEAKAAEKKKDKKSSSGKDSKDRARR
jgi:Domain of unknown function (DUF4110)